MHKVFSDPVLITAQMGETKSGATVEDRQHIDGDSVVVGVSIAGRSEMWFTK